MRSAGAHLTYCTNIHPGESWDAVFENVRTHVVAVKARVAPNEPFGVGLRLSARAAANCSRSAATVASCSSAVPDKPAR